MEFFYYVDYQVAQMDNNRDILSRLRSYTKQLKILSFNLFEYSYQFFDILEECLDPIFLLYYEICLHK